MRFAKSVIICLLAYLPAIAHAAPEKFFYKGLYKTELNASSSDSYIDGAIAIRSNKHSIKLTLQPKMPVCPEGKMCIQVMPEPITYLLEDSKSYYDGCGALVTEASFDQRPVDGIYMKVIVRDNANNRGGSASACFSKVAVAPTEVTVEQDYYSRLDGHVQSVDRFRGEALSNSKALSLPPEPFKGQINKLRYAKETQTLVVNLTYGGGCREHDFALEWGTCKMVPIGRRTVKECEVTLMRTQGQDDLCKALITKDHSIDLSQLGALYIINLDGRRVRVGG